MDKVIDLKGDGGKVAGLGKKRLRGSEIPWIGRRTHSCEDYWEPAVYGGGPGLMIRLKYLDPAQVVVAVALAVAGKGAGSNVNFDQGVRVMLLWDRPDACPGRS
ncbi:MAG: hypothetical protein Ct9H300mP16_03950 [Pseudomonadota bacterium]|nr:MAG: hypothetical protein Ct9H300mP16_03950 [Pseudomonadota bacterium]